MAESGKDGWWMQREVVCPGKPTTLVEGFRATDTHYVRVNNLKWSKGGQVTVGATKCWLDLILSPFSYARSYPDPEWDLAPVSGPLAFAPPGTRLRHSWRQNDLRTMTCLFDPEAMMPLSGFRWDWNSVALAPVNGEGNQRLRYTLRLLADEIVAPGFASDIQIESLLLLAACRLRELVGLKAEEPSDRHRLGSAALNRLRAMLEDPARDLPTLPMLADELRLDARQLSRMFKLSTGITLRDYAAQARIKRARQLLADRSLLIKQVAHRCGFSTTASFSAAFHKAAGTTPLAYRATLAS